MNWWHFSAGILVILAVDLIVHNWRQLLRRRRVPGSTATSRQERT